MILRSSKLSMLAAVLMLPLGGAVASAASISFVTPIGATTSGPVSARADLTTSLNTVQLTLTNLTVNPTDVAQNLSAFTFTLDGTFTAASLTSSSSTERSLDDKNSGVYTDGTGTVAAGWAFTAPSTNVLKVDVLTGVGHVGPTHTIIGAPAGDNEYDNANGSLAGNPPHNPFLNQVATFTFNVTGVTAQTSITSVLFQFGTTDGGDTVPGTPVPHTHPVPVPAAAWSGFSLLAVLGIGAAIRRKHV